MLTVPTGVNVHSEVSLSWARRVTSRKRLVDLVWNGRSVSPRVKMYVEVDVLVQPDVTVNQEHAVRVALGDPGAASLRELTERRAQSEAEPACRAPARSNRRSMITSSCSTP